MFAILFEVLLIEIQEEIHHFAGWEGGSRGTKIANKHVVNKLAFLFSAGGKGTVFLEVLEPRLEVPRASIRAP